MEHLVVALAALAASTLTLFSGFGLGTLLMPVFALFFPVELAVAATALVHGANGALKVALLGRAVAWPVALRFGLPAIAAAFAGAWLLGAFADLAPWATWTLGGATHAITPIKATMGALMIGFAALELHPRYERLALPARLLPVGGALSGFFGGLSGHQGALRAAFLAKCDLTPTAFVATSAVLGLTVDVARLVTYGATLPAGVSSALGEAHTLSVVAVGVVAAFAGVVLGKRLLGKVTMRAVQRLTGVMLMLLGLLLGAGIL